MDQVTRQNAALVEQASASAQSMREQAAQLAAAVGRFKLQDGPVAQQAIRVSQGQAAPATLRPGLFPIDEDQLERA